MTHTPGPWGIEPTTYGYHGYHVMSADNKQLARVDDIETARLIAAAPEMLECLQAWAELDNEGALPTRERMQKVYAAIAKATEALAEKAPSCKHVPVPGGTLTIFPPNKLVIVDDPNDLEEG